DLIVIGATGSGAIQRTLIGSTSDFVVNHALCNVLVVR
ncbi:universal stress protein, partial [Enterococcus faecalis]